MGEDKAGRRPLLPREAGEGDHAKRGGGGARHDHALGHARDALGARDCARAHPLSLGDAGGRRGVAVSARSPDSGRIRGRADHVRGARHARNPEPACSVWERASQSRLRRSHRRRAPRRCQKLAVRSVRGRDRRRRALGPRRVRHEGRRRRRCGRRLALHRQGVVCRIAQLSHHRRRGRTGGQRHGQAPRLGAGEG